MESLLLCVSLDKRGTRKMKSTYPSNTEFMRMHWYFKLEVWELEK